MKYSYSVNYMTVGLHRYPVLQLPKEIELVTTLLLADLQGPAQDVQEEYLSEIDRVLQGFASYSEIGGNVCRIEIRPDFTRVIDTLDKNPATNSCLIETQELKEIIEIWCTLLGDRSQYAESAA